MAQSGGRGGGRPADGEKLHSLRIDLEERQSRSHPSFRIAAMEEQALAHTTLCEDLCPLKILAFLSSQLGGKRVGIVGLGNIGSEVAKRLAAFGCKISYNSRKKKPFVSFPFYHDVCELAANCDILVICCAITDQTHHMINKEVLLALGEEGVIVNIGRGAVIDEKELVWCLVEGKIAGAGLDVFENEPQVPKELFALDNVVLSPHRAVFTDESFLDLYELISGNFEAFFSDKPLLSPVVLDEWMD